MAVLTMGDITQQLSWIGNENACRILVFCLTYLHLSLFQDTKTIQEWLAGFSETLFL